ncbi:MAG: tRNA (adenosine(37)-N6)-dimethylallyltransferase MiaA [Flavobacteriales bacterium]|nr:tRNA (adenosine(37)-N6)-dimethylallyltransferase MiaA [Flavobacteriales bacterium]
MKTTKKLLVIYGPTAVGKTNLAIQLALQHKTEIISADSRQFFKEMKIGTAVPEQKELDAINHHFIQHKSILENYNVGLFEKEAISKIEQLFKHHKTLIMVGGSGLYIDAVCKGLDTFPNIEENLRKELRLKFEEYGLQWLQDEVKKIDPIFYANSDVNNYQRLLRCLEVCKQSGQTFSSFKNKQNKKRPFEVEYISIKMDRERLYKRINDRVDIMMEKGLLKEVESLKKFKDLNALKTVGYNELFQYLDKDISIDRAVKLIKQNSRRYAKRQMTWLKRYPIKWIESQ